MKTRKFFGFLMILASGFLFLNCTSDPIPGPPGKDGIDGVDGQDGQDGVSGTASCVACHSSATRDPINAAFAISSHNNTEENEDAGNSNGTVTRSDSQSCAQCHGEQGYIEFIETGAVAADFPTETPISCATCHDMHRSFDFENDGPDYALRAPDAKQLLLAPSITVDFEGSSNNCISCHQPRPSYPIPALNADGIYVVTSSRFGPHHGPQSTVFEGILGAEIPGSEPYPAPGNVGVADGNGHRALSSCVNCHMADANEVEIGGHSWHPVESKCIECHQAVPGEANGFSADMATLRTLLQQVEGVAYQVDEEGDPVFDENGDYIPTETVVVGLLRPGSEDRTNEGIFSDVAAMGAWNYKTAYEDQSRGIHNPDYIKALLKNSIQALQNEN
ncbi:MAG: multiheme c-type cytochrome [Robiginitalea sp.]|jgi:hypothetical protein